MGRDSPERDGPPQTLYTRFLRWSEAGIFNRIFADRTASRAATDILMLDAPSLNVHCTTSSLLEKGLYPAVSGAPTAV